MGRGLPPRVGVGSPLPPSPCLLLLLLLLLLLGPAHGWQRASEEGVVTKMDIHTSIRHHYATTLVSTTLHNPRPRPAALTFRMALPPAALVSSFVVEAEGGNYTGRVYDRQSAGRVYDASRRDGKTVATLDIRDDGVARVSASTRVAALRSLTFHVTYEHLVPRTAGARLYSLPIRAGQRVAWVDVVVEVDVSDKITDYRLLDLPGQEMVSPSPGTSVTGGQASPSQLRIHYHHQDPPQGPARGVEGTLTLSYTTTIHPDGGVIQHMGGYFAHFLSPEPLPALSTHSLLLLDVSRSMKAPRLSHLQEVLSATLRSTRPSDSFELMVFSSDVVSLGTYTGRRRDVKRATRKLRRLKALGDSDLNSALLQALKNTADHKGPQAFKQIILFTDGQATSGITDEAALRRNIKAVNTDNIPIFSLVFGDNKKLIEAITTDHQGFVTMITPTKKLDKQIRTFLKRVSHPLMASLNVRYQGVDSGSLVRVGTENYYSGSEILVAGRVSTQASNIRPVVSGEGGTGSVDLQVTRYHYEEPPHSRQPSRDNPIARLWGYLKVQELIRLAETSVNHNLTRRFYIQALEVAEQFNFVTPMTSMVVVFPDTSLLLEQPSQRQVWSVPPRTLTGLTGQDIAAAYTESRRPGRSYMYDTQHTLVDLDPHFVVRTQGVKVPLCFYFTSPVGTIVSLVRDPLSDIIINGQMSPIGRQRTASYFTRLFLKLGGVNITVSTHSIQIDCLDEDQMTQTASVTNSLWPFYKANGRRYKYREDKKIRRRKNRKQTKQMSNNISEDPAHGGRPNHSRGSRQSPRTPTNINNIDANSCHLNTTWENGVGRMFGDVLVTMSRRRRLQLQLGDGLAHFTIVRSTKTRVLGLHIKHQRVFSPETQGIIGELLSKNVRLMSGTEVSEDDNRRRVKVEIGGGSAVEGVVSGTVVRRRSMMGRGHSQCISVNALHTPLLLHPHDHYLLHCLTC